MGYYKRVEGTNENFSKEEGIEMRTLDFGKNKGKSLKECEVSYLKWLVSHEQVLAERNRWASRDAKFILVMLEREQESAKALAELRKDQVFDSILGEWVTPSSDNALDVVRDSKWGYAIERIAKNRDMAQKRAEITDISRRGNFGTKAFSILR